MGLYDRALVIVVADHGLSFWPNEPVRVAEEKNWADILAVPLVKVPHQRMSVVSDRNVEIIDVLPTIADILGAELPWVIDGRSVLESSHLRTISEGLLQVGIRSYGASRVGRWS